MTACWKRSPFDLIQRQSYALRIPYRSGFSTTTVTVSEKYQIVVPREARAALGIRPGQSLRVLVYEGRVELLPERDIREMRGFLGPLDTTRTEG